ncbi:hypothetical protein NDU88_002227 [Pleurodeles waltl]|uniref:Uncharacterized protein n=1 Tax=Pleurodeles waltl TaxID=8319 RepID=A0AAV7W1S8_PLEWA|nr:hypothetical protein NDU88_002227 [Pleurodeles waltl]
MRKEDRKRVSSECRASLLKRLVCTLQKRAIDINAGVPEKPPSLRAHKKGEGSIAEVPISDSTCQNGHLLEAKTVTANTPTPIPTPGIETAAVKMRKEDRKRVSSECRASLLKRLVCTLQKRAIDINAGVPEKPPSVRAHKKGEGSIAEVPISDSTCQNGHLLEAKTVTADTPTPIPTPGIEVNTGLEGFF